MILATWRSSKVRDCKSFFPKFKSGCNLIKQKKKSASLLCFADKRIKKSPLGQKTKRVISAKVTVRQRKKKGNFVRLKTQKSGLFKS